MMDSEPDLHVVSLRYALRSSDQVTYVDPPPVEFETQDACFRLASGKLICKMKTHFSTPDAARALVEPTLKAWEVDADLRWNRGELRFVFEGADIIDRSPVPPGQIRGQAFMTEGSDVVCMVGTVSVHVTRDQYPDPPPPTFRLNPDAESILFRYREYLDGRVPLPEMAYFCLTVVQTKGRRKGKRREDAAQTFRIHKDVLGKIGELTSERGGRQDARKAGSWPPLTGPERAWLEAAVKMLIWRVGDSRVGDTHAADLPLITMADLPTS